MKFMKRLLSTVTAAVIGVSMTTALSTGVAVTTTAADMTAVELVEDMGLGWNLGNTFDGTNTWTSSPTPEQIETAWGNVVTTENMIKEIKKAGFNTVRIPVTWWDMTDASGTRSMSDFDGTVGEAYFERIKEVVDYCIDNGMYAVINTHHDEDWEKDTSKLSTFKTLWTNIATYFKDYDEHLVFEGMNEVSFSSDSDAMTYNQAFVDTVRATGGNNSDRLLICAAASNNTSKALSSSFSLPDDDSNMLAVSVHYYEPSTFCVADTTSSWGYRDTWGTASDLTLLENDFNDLKEKYIDNGYGVVIGEYGVCNADKYGIGTTTYNKDEDSIEAFYQAVASTAYNMEGMCAIAWDDSDSGTIALFSRKTMSWYATEVEEILSNIASGGIVDNGKTKTDRLTFSASDILDPDSTSGALLIDLTPYKDYGVNLSSVVINYTISGNKSSYGTGGAVQYNIVDSTDESTHWAYQAYAFTVGEDVTTVDIPETTSTSDDEGNTYEGPLDMDYLKIEHWYDWTDPTGGTVEWSYGDITLIFDDYFYVEGDSDTTTSTDETQVTTTTTTAAEVTTTTAEETTTVTTTLDPDATVYGNVWIAGQAGAYAFWDTDADGVTPVTITGNGTYTVQYDITEGDGTGSIECLILDSDVNLYAFLDEDYEGSDPVTDCGVTYNIEKITLDGEEIEYTGPTDGSMCYGNDGVSLRRNILNTWTSPKIKDIDGTEVTLTKQIEITFTVSGLPTDNVVVETTTTTEATTAPATTTTTTEEVTTTTTEATTTTTAPETTTTVATTTTTARTTVEISASLLGDVNLDGKVSLPDAVLLSKKVADVVTFTSGQSANADCNADGSVDGKDAVSLLRFLVTIIDSLPDLA